MVLWQITCHDATCFIDLIHKLEQLFAGRADDTVKKLLTLAHLAASVCRAFPLFFLILTLSAPPLCSFCYLICSSRPSSSKKHLWLRLDNRARWCHRLESKHNYATHIICKWAASAGSPGTASVIYFSLVPWLNTGPRGPKTRPAHQGFSRCSRLANPGLSQPLFLAWNGNIHSFSLPWTVTRLPTSSQVANAVCHHGPHQQRPTFGYCTQMAISFAHNALHVYIPLVLIGVLHFNTLYQIILQPFQRMEASVMNRSHTSGWLSEKWDQVSLFAKRSSEQCWYNDYVNAWNIWKMHVWNAQTLIHAWFIFLMHNLEAGFLYGV